MLLEANCLAAVRWTLSCDVGGILTELSLSGLFRLSHSHPESLLNRFQRGRERKVLEFLWFLHCEA